MCPQLDSDNEEIVACFKREDFPHFHTGKFSNFLFPMTRIKAHETKTPHLISRIYAVTEDGRYLVQQRNFSKRSNPGLFTDSASGHIHFQPHLDYEYIEYEAFRELEEEMGTHILFGRLVDINLEEFRAGGCELSYNFFALVEAHCNPDPIETSKGSGFYTHSELLRLLEKDEFVPITKKYWCMILDNDEHHKILAEYLHRPEISKNLADYNYYTFNIKTDESVLEHSGTQLNNFNSKAKWHIGAIVGRFQPFHQGHLQLLLKALTDVDVLKIGIGSMQYSKTSENPFTFPEREEMIRRTLNANDIPPERYQIIGVADLHDMVKWTRSLLDILDPFDIFYSNNEWTRQLLLQTGKLVAPLYKFQFDRFNGTYIRNRIVRNQPIDDLIPGSVMQYLKEIDGFTRIRKFIDNP